jgi:hypothetical protein
MWKSRSEKKPKKPKIQEPKTFQDYARDQESRFKSMYESIPQLENQFIEMKTELSTMQGLDNIMRYQELSVSLKQLEQKLNDIKERKEEKAYCQQAAPLFAEYRLLLEESATVGTADSSVTIKSKKSTKAKGKKRKRNTKNPENEDEKEEANELADDVTMATDTRDLPEITSAKALAKRIKGHLHPPSVALPPDSNLPTSETVKIELVKLESLDSVNTLGITESVKQEPTTKTEEPAITLEADVKPTESPKLLVLLPPPPPAIPITPDLVSFCAPSLVQSLLVSMKTTSTITPSHPETGANGALVLHHDQEEARQIHLEKKKRKTYEVVETEEERNTQNNSQITSGSSSIIEWNRKKQKLTEKFVTQFANETLLPRYINPEQCKRCGKSFETLQFVAKLFCPRCHTSQFFFVCCALSIQFGLHQCERERDIS